MYSETSLNTNHLETTWCGVAQERERVGGEKIIQQVLMAGFKFNNNESYCMCIEWKTSKIT